MDTTVIQMKELSFRYPGRDNFSLEAVNMSVRQGDFVLVTGPTGCGKSTLLKCCNGLIPHLSKGTMTGVVHIDGVDSRGTSMHKLAGLAGMVQQNPDDQIFATVVRDEVAFGPENLCVSPDLIEQRMKKALAQVGLEKYMYRRTTALSGGEKQRLVIAAMLVMEPKILVLDEPISQLDPQGVKEVLEVVASLHQTGTTIIMAEHRIHEVAHLTERIIIMDRGKIVRDGEKTVVLADTDLFRRMGLRLPEPVEISKRMGKSKLAVTVPDAIELLKHGKKKPRESVADGLLQSSGQDEIAVFMKDVSHCYGKSGNDSLKKVSLTIRRGEKVAVMGRNGAGKSTLLQHLAGLIPMQKGEGYIGDVPLHGKNRKKQIPVGMVFQNPDLMLSHSRVDQEVEFGMEGLPFSASERNELCREIMRIFHLEELAGDSPHSLSRGQRQRVAVASVLAMRPEVVLLDEPTTGQDKGHIATLMEGVCKKADTVVFCTHDAETAFRYATRIIVMDQGTVAADMLPRQFFAKPEMLSSCGLRPIPSWIIGQGLGVDDVFTPIELEDAWVC